MSSKFNSFIVNKQQHVEGEVDFTSTKRIYINTKTNAGMNTVVEGLLPFINHLASKTRFYDDDLEDKRNVMYVIALEGVRNYDPSKNTTLLHFLKAHITNRVKNIYKFQTRQKRTATSVNIQDNDGEYKQDVKPANFSSFAGLDDEGMSFEDMCTDDWNSVLSKKEVVISEKEFNDKIKDF